MSDRNRPDDLERVTQADREAAAGFYQEHLSRPGEVPVEAAMRVGHIDESPLIQAFVRHRLAALAASPTASDTDTAIPGGWKLVPIKPTREMKVAGGKAFNPDDDVSVVTSFEAGQAWYAMLAASPNPEPSHV